MPQELRVVCCFQCLKYQVDIVKKANKWVCKMCSVKQSLAREYFRGSGQDCRSMVQQLSVRHLEMDQREAEVAKLVLQNKIQLPQPPPMDPVDLRNEATKGSIPTSQEPSKWATFLTKEEKGDLSDALDASESLESVSSSTFDRERIGCPVNKAEARSGYRTAKHDSFDSDAQMATNTHDKWATERSNPVFAAKNEDRRTNPFHNCRTANWNQTTGESTMQLPAFHRKENCSNRSFTNLPPTFTQLPNHQSAQTFVQNPSTSNAASASASYKLSQIPCKRTFSEASASVPLMNFAKRTTERTSTGTIFNPSAHNVEHNSSQNSSTPSNVSSKWAKFMPEDDETDENTDSNFITF